MPGPNDMQPTPGNVKKLARLQKIMQRMFDECLVRDFHGTSNVELQIQ